MHDSRNASIEILALACLLLISVAGPAEAATPLADVSLVPDTPAVRDGGAILVVGGSVVGQSPGDSSALASLGVLPSNSAVRGYHFDSAEVQLFSLDLPAELGSALVLPSDVARFDGSSYVIEFDGGLAGIPDGTGVDAISRMQGDLLLSFDTPVSLGGITLDPGDLVRWNGVNAAIVFDAALWGVPTGLNLDAAHHLGANDHLLLSFDGSGRLGAIDFDDEDVLEFDGVSWELAIDSSAVESVWGVANLQALHVVTAAEDNCAGVLNPGQINSDTDAMGNECDPDDDNDGLLDGVETDTGIFVDAMDTGTNPLVADTDGDGVSDGDEVSAGTDPTIANVASVPSLGPVAGLLLAALLLLAGRQASARRL